MIIKKKLYRVYGYGELFFLRNRKYKNAEKI